MNATGASAIAARDLRMAYGANEVLAGVDLHVGAGEVVALLGPNGAGKTTTIEILEGFRAPSAGHAEVLGVEPLRGDEAWRARVGVVLQTWRDHSRWRVRELVHHVGEFYGPYATPERPRPWPVDELLERVGLAGFADRRVMTLSGGERRRLDVAVGLVGVPEVLFLDEPTAGFDPAARRDFHDLIRGLADDDVAVLFTTHDLDEAEKLADRILILAAGRIVAQGSPDALRRRTSRRSEVRWHADGVTHVHATEDPADFLRGVLADPRTTVTDLEVRRASLEDAYLALVHRVETGADLDHDEASRMLASYDGRGGARAAPDGLHPAGYKSDTHEDRSKEGTS